MVAATYTYRPDYAVPPGWILEEHLKSQSLSPAELARRCGRSAKLISEIIVGKAPVEPKTALQFEKVLGSRRRASGSALKKIAISSIGRERRRCKRQVKGAAVLGNDLSS